MLTLSLLLLLAPLSVLTRPTSVPRSSPTIQTIHAFPPGVALENIAPRSNGHLLLTATSQSTLYDIDPRTSSPALITLPGITGVSGVLGIAETSPDVFAVAAGNFTGEQAVSGSFSVWSVNMNTAPATVKLITAIPEAECLNGAAALNGLSGNVLIADSYLGAVWKVDVTTGHYSIAMQNPAFAPNASPGSFGINGLRTSGSSLYFTNSAQGIFGSVRIRPDGSAAGDVTVLATREQATYMYDDFDMDLSGNAWIATHPGMVKEVTRGGVQTNLTGEGTSFEQPTSARFGRESQSGTLYVVDAESARLTAVTNIS